MQNKIDISHETYAAEMVALSDYYRNRSLVLAQQLADVTKGLHEASDTVAKLREDAEDDRALAALLRAFVDEGNIAPPAVEGLMHDARRITSSRETE